MLALGRHTVTGMLAAGGRQNQDWTAAYRLFGKSRIRQRELFAPAIKKVMENQEGQEPLYTMMDDTIIRKRGRKISGTGWKRDPLGPAFHTNFVWGQRYLQISAALPDSEVPGRARGIPVSFQHAPPAAKPRKNASPEALEEYKRQQKLCKISAVGAACLADLRDQIPEREIVCAVDGGYTNQEVFRSIPEGTTLIGRIRKDASLFQVPEKTSLFSRGRKKYYGERLPTPEQARKDPSIPWQKITAFAAGKYHEFEIKTLAPVRWKSSKDRDMLVVIIRPLAYRPSKNSRLLYRDPAYLICSDPLLPLDKLLQAYLWRWEIELNFRDEKTIFGVGEAQVRTPQAVQNLPAFIVAAYAFLLLAAHSLQVMPACLPSTKWYPQKPSARCSTQKILSLFRAFYWNLNINLIKSGFVSNSLPSQTHFFSSFSLSSALLLALK